MEILEIRAFEGPSIYSHKPVIRMRLALGVYAEQPTNLFEGFTDKLLASLPGLYEHHCCRGRKGGFVERLYEGTYLGHVIEHIALELQIMWGYDVAYGKVREIGPDGIYDIVYAYRTKVSGIWAGRTAFTIVKALIEKEEMDLQTELNEIKRHIAEKELGPSTAAIVAVAEQRGIPVRRIGEGSLLVMGYGKKQKRVQATTTHFTGCIAADIACDKALTKEILEEAGIPVPCGVLVDSVKEAAETARWLGRPVAIKPCNGSKGQGVTLRLEKQEEIAQAFLLAKEISEQVMVEEFVEGRQYRVLVVNNKVVAVAERIAASVIGNGKSTVQELIDVINMDSIRGEDHEKPLTKIKVDPIVTMVLERQNYTMQSIPAQGEIVYLRENANISTGGTAIDVTEQIHPDNIRLAVRAVQRIGLDVAGIDIVSKDISKPLKKNGGAIIEINAAPGIRMHHYPSKGKPRDVANVIVEGLFPRGDRGLVPIVSITGTNGKTTTTRMVGHMLSMAGQCVGMTTTDGIFIGDECIMEGDTTGPDSARTVLYDPAVEIAVLETARGGILRGGLAFKECDIAVVTNVTEDHLGQDGVQDLTGLAYIKSLIVETIAVQGYGILNADDPYTLPMIKCCRGKVVLFSLKENSPVIRRHLSIGQRAVFLRDGYIIWAEGCRWERIIRIADIPVTLGGVAKHNLQNAMMAAAVGLCLDMSIPIIRQALRTFAQNPGRLNLIDVGNFRIMVDYGHNPAGYEALIETLKQLNAARLIGVIGAPGDRRDDVITNIGRTAGQGFDNIIIKEDGDLRGRSKGETAQLLWKGAIQAGRAEHEVQIILSEMEAVLHALEHAKENDLIAICYEKYDSVMGVINDFCLGKRQLAIGGEEQCIPVAAEFG
jgi:cyanophycin synthetase